MKSFNLDSWIVYRMWRVSQEAGFELEAWYGSAFGLTAPEWHSLAMLANHAPLSAKELACLLDISQVQMTRTLSKLHSDGLAFRNTDDRDRRRVVLGLTRKGLRLYNKIAPKAAAIEDRMLAAFSPRERNQFDAFLGRLEALFRH